MHPWEKEKSRPFTEKTVVLSEGTSDAAFLLKLKTSRSLTGFQIYYGNGKKEFWKELIAIATREDFEVLKSVIILTDNDDDVRVAVADAIEQVNKANQTSKHKFPTPSAAFQLITNERLSLAIVMLPSQDELGCLETLLLKSIPTDHPLFKCVDGFASCSSAERWPIQKASKMKVASLVAASCLSNPTCSPTYIWSDNLAGEIPFDINSSCFDGLIESLMRYVIV